ncbi:MAG: lysophospholipid acyltransferase family protein [Desulfobulbus sp.]|nr:lysophospholipid acyltransferase family protein [Desulfobulbus sp.]
MADFWYKSSLAVAPPVVATLLKAWFSTCRLQVRGRERLDAAVREHGSGIAALWHYSFPYIFYHLRVYSAAVMVSSSRDGEYIARLAEQFHHVPVRGSSNLRGFRALLEMVEQVRHGSNAVIVADGSQGPARQAQAGAIFVASKSGRPIMPMAWAADRCIAFNSWDRTLIPKPFANIVLHHGEPFFVPADLSRTEIEAYRQELEERLNRLYDEVWGELGLPAHDLDAVQRQEKNS